MASYTPQQLYRFYDRVHFPHSDRKPTIQPNGNGERLAYLALLMRHFLVHVPFEDFSLHYSQSKSITLDPDALYEKFLGTPDDPLMPYGRGRGGYCMENNGLFGNVLRTLGYDVTSVGGRVYNPAHFEGFGHMINLVTFNDDVYSVDVGFGGSGPIRPLKLPSEQEIAEKGHGEPVENMPYTEMRIAWGDPHEVQEARRKKDFTKINNPTPTRSAGNLSSSLKPQRNCFIFESRRVDINQDWQPMYAFVAQHFAMPDYLMMNHFTSSHPAVFFTYSLVCVRMVAASELNDEESLVRKVLLDTSMDSISPRELARAASRMLVKYRGSSPEDESRIVAQVILFGKSLKLRVENETFPINEAFETEDMRVDALRRFFGLHLKPQEVRGIRGTITAI